MSFPQQTRVPSPTGALLNVYRQFAESDPVGVVQINHGLAEHAERYGRFAGYLAARGFHVYAHDHRGHGRTVADGAPPRCFGRDGHRKVVADVATVHDLIASRHPGLPVICFGHSMGGLIALNFAVAHSPRIAGLAVWNANFSAGMPGRAAQALLLWERLRLGSDVPSRLLPKLTFRAWARQVKDRRTDFDWLSHDAAEVDTYIADPLCGWNPSVGMWRDVFRLIFDGADDRRLRAIRRDLPVNLMGGGQDPATDNGQAVLDLERRMRSAGFSNLISTLYAENRHESLNELNRNVIMDSFAQWARDAVST